jgi:hypothetical protein
LTADNSAGGARLTDAQEVVWVEDGTPEGASLSAAPDDAWDWTNAFWNGSELVGPYSGSLMHLSPLSVGWHRHFFSKPGLSLLVNPGELLFSYVCLPWTNAPSMVMLEWLAGDTSGPGSASWGHRVFWGGQNVSTNGSATNAFYAGALPPAGQWVRLSVPAGAVALEGQLVRGISFAICDGTAAWDRAGKVVANLGANGPASGQGQSGVGAPGGAGMNGAGPLSQSSSCVNPPAGLVGWWQGQNSCSDFLGLDNGVSQGNLAYTAGEVGNAFSLNGTDADVRVPASTTLNVGAGPGFSVEGWINPADLESQPIVEWNNPNAYPSYGVHFWSSVVAPWGSGPGCLYANLIDTYGRDNYFTTPGSLFSAGGWHHVALTFNESSGLACIYLDGSLEGSDTFGAFTPQTAWDFYLGARVTPGGTVRWYGGLDEISLYDRALGAAEISAIYNAGSAGKCTGPPACVQPPAGLVSWWPAEGNCTDCTGLNNGTAQGALSYSSGEVNEAFYLNGSADVEVPASSSLNVGTGSFTVETWINPGDLSSSRPIVEWNSGGGSVPYGVHFWSSVATPYGNGPGCLYANVLDTSGNSHYFTSLGGLLTVSAWQHVALVYDHTAGNAYMYLDGRQVASHSVGVFNAQTTFPLYFGARLAGPAMGYWLGGIDEVSLYNQALSQAQIQSIYNAGSAGKCPAVPASFTGLINLDFGPASTSPKAGRAVLGDTANGVWNYLGPSAGNSIANLKNADGTASPVSATMAGLPAAGNDGCASDAMYNGYVTAGLNQSGTVTLNGLPSGTYTVLAYSYDGDFSLAAGGVDCGTLTTSYNLSPMVSPPSWSPGLHYASWSGVALATGQPLVLTVLPGPHDGYPVLCGLQAAQMDASGLPIYWELEYFGQSGVDPNADPDGDGLPNLAEYELQTNPTVPDNPLILSTLANGAQVSGYEHLPLGIAAGLESPAITLYVDGLPAANSCLEQSGGQWYLDWNTVFLPNGNHSLCVAFQYNPDASYGQTGTVFGPSKTVQVANMMTFDQLTSQFTANLYIEALTVPNASYQVNLYDDNGNPLVSTTGTADGTGQIQLAWDLTDPITHQQISFGNINAGFAITPPGGQPTIVWEWFIKEPPPQPATTFVVAWGWDIYSTTFGQNNNNMILNGVINILGNSADPNPYALAPPANIPYATTFRYDTDADKKVLTNALYGSSLFFWFGHGSQSVFGGNPYHRSATGTGDIRALLQNLSSFSTPTHPHQDMHAYKLVILNGCETYSAGWASAFGIPFYTNSSTDTVVQYLNIGRMPRAFVGWTKEIDVPATYLGIDSTTAHTEYGSALAQLFGEWMAGYYLYQCVGDFARVALSYQFLGQDSWSISGCYNLTDED